VNIKGRYRHQSQHKVTANGFTIVEVLIAGILMASALTAVGRLSVAALSVSAHSSARASMEAAINDNIQTMQKEDSYFTQEWIKNNDKYNFETACSSPAETLGEHLKTIDQDPRLIVHVDSEPSSTVVSKNKPITRTFDFSTIPGILKISYSFEGPEKQIEDEIRVIEMNPNFASQCYQT